MTWVTSRPALRSIARLLAPLLLAACATAGPPPYAELSASARKLASAEVAVAGGVARAELAAARSKLEAAEAALAAGDNDDAWRLAVQAGLDAELADALTRAAKAEARLAQHLDQPDTTVPASFVRRDGR